MKRFTMEMLVEAAEECKSKMGSEESIEKRELLSRAYAQITDILADELLGDINGMQELGRESK